MEPVTASAVLGLLSKAVDKALSFIPDPTQRAKAQMDILALKDSAEARDLAALVESDKGQIEVNKLEAASNSLFKGGWRPGAGWVCTFALGYQMLLRPLFGWVALNVWGWSAPPPLEIDTLLTLLFGMLGLGVYRTTEKLKGVA